MAPNDELPPGFTTEPIANAERPPKDFPAEERAPGEFVEAHEDPKILEQAARAAESAHVGPVTNEPALPPATPGNADSGPVSAAAAPPAPVPAAPTSPDPFVEATERAEAVASPLVQQHGQALVDPTLQPDLRSVPGAEPAEKYWVGTLPGAPVQNITLAGICFPLFSETVNLIAGDTIRTRHNGSVLDMSQTRLDRIKEAMGRKVIRWRDAKKRHGYIVTIPTQADVEAMKKRGRYRPFIAHANDEPIGRYVYIVRGGRTSDTEFPPSVVPRE